MRIRNLVLSLIAAVSALGGAQTPALTTRLPVDSKVTIDTLPNGMRYYIRKNSRPEKRAELRLVVNAGSILEDNDQRGLAHFVEHTAFNGTTNFKKNDLIGYLQSIGVRFGADLNAYTGFDETVYILPVPTDTARILEKAFDILEDFAHGQIFDSLEVVNERGVVLEEWRGGKGASERMMQVWLPIAFKGSRYATRLPIGTDTSIRTASPSKLRRFYRDWYRPDLMAIVAVGDFDPARIEALIKQHFSGIPKAARPRPRIEATIPDNAAPLVAITKDKEAQGSSVELIFKMKKPEMKTVGDYRRSLIQSLALSMFNTRFAEITQKPNAPFLGAGAGVSGFFARGTNAFSVGAGVDDGGVLKGAEALLIETKRVQQHGFLDSELQRAKSNLARGYERAYAEREKTESGSLVGEYVSHYLTGEAIPGVEYEYGLVQQLLPGITVADVNAVARGWITDRNRVIIAQGPDKPGVSLPTESELLAVFSKAATATVAAYTETLSADALVDPLPTPGSVVSESKNDAIGVTEWKLSNGIRVLVKPTDFKADQVLLTGTSEGGTSLASDADFMSAWISSQLMTISGVGQFSAVDLQKKMSGKAAVANAGLRETDNQVSGSASPKDLEAMFQLVHLRMTAPRLDRDAWAAMKQQVAPYFANRGTDPGEVFGDTISVTRSGGHFRDRPLTAATFAEVDPDKALQFYRDRFANAGNFTFAIVGNVKLEELKPLVERYLASLPAGKPETFRDVNRRTPGGIVERVVRKGTEPKAMTQIYFSGPAEYTPHNRFMMRAMNELMQMRLNDVLREQLGGTYSPGIGGSISRTPKPEFEIQIQYGSSPENVDRLAKSVMQIIDSVQKHGPTAAEVDKVREQITRAREVEIRTNTYWAGNLVARDRAGEDIAGLGAPYDAFLKGLTAAQLQEATRKYFNPGSYMKFVLLPEK
ncbi:MAG TPA: insulinase family protein [Gemmatimonadaceae bacterium]|nr:insulinase family protein [Gemmatimonadaceae bacterium]